MRRPIGVDLFSGAGGMSLGFEQAGFDVVAAVEIDPVHAAVHKHNFSNCAVIPRSISDLNAGEIRHVAGIGSRPVDVVFGGPPCQGFSLIGHRAFDDPRNGLVAEFVRVVSELDASYFVFENVKGLTLGRHRAFLDELVAAFESVGYGVRLPWNVLDSADFGVPQHRERLILLGAKQGLPLPEYPTETCRPADKREADLLSSLHPAGPNCHDALGDLPDADCFETLRSSDAVRVSNWTGTSAYSRELRCIDDASWHYGYTRYWDPSILTSSARTEHTRISRRRFAAAPPGTVEPISRFYKLAPDGLCNTLRAGTDAARGAFTSPRPIHYAYARCVTVREMARLHGFPDWFRFNCTKWHGARQIGNAVTPPLGRAIAEQIVRVLGLTPQRPTATLDLGDTRLLHMDSSRASSYFGITVALRRRDRKSGAKKRRQTEIEATEVLEGNVFA